MSALTGDTVTADKVGRLNRALSFFKIYVHCVVSRYNPFCFCWAESPLHFSIVLVILKRLSKYDIAFNLAM